MSPPSVDSRLGPFRAEKVRILATFGGTVLALDLATKWMIQERFFLGQTRPILGDVFRLTYILNPGAAFGIQAGNHSRLIFTVLATCVLLFLLALYRWTPLDDRLRLTAIAMVCGGALGNLLDRVISPFGVVDFLDVGIGGVRWPVFNLADIAITCGALMLASSFWQEGREAEAPTGEGPAAGEPEAHRQGAAAVGSVTGAAVGAPRAAEEDDPGEPDVPRPRGGRHG